MTAEPDNWMPLYIGSYLKKTTRLTRDQHGAYFLLIMDSWINGPPPDDNKVLASICKASLAEWRRLRPVLEPFFSIDGGEWHHGKIERERGRARAIIEKKRKAGAAGGAAARGKSGRKKNGEKIAGAIQETIADLIADELQNNTPLPSPSHSPNGDTSSLRSEVVVAEKPKPQKPRQSKPEHPTFPPWYEAFPRHEARGEAAAAYTAALARASPEQLLAGAQRYAAHVEARGEKKFTKLPATWLNKGCWDDAYEVHHDNSRKPTKIDNLFAGARGAVDLLCGPEDRQAEGGAIIDITPATGRSVLQP